MRRRSQPPGFRFQPTHVELLMFYLKRKVMQKKLPPGVISELDIYTYAPWDLPDKSCMKSGELKWYFFCSREKKYASGGRMNRATKFGFWKSTGRDRPVSYNNQTVGQIKTLTFFRGKAPKGDQTDWVMHEYRIEETYLSLENAAQDAYVLCVIFQKDGPGPRNGAQYGAPFIEEDWSDDGSEEVDISSGLLPSKGPSNSFAPYTSTTPNNIVGSSSTSYITENLASTSNEIPQIASGSIDPVEIPQNLDNVDDGITMEELFAPYTSTTPNNIFGFSSASYITEKLASTSKEIPQIASGSIDPVEIPQNLDNVNDVVTTEERFAPYTSTTPNNIFGFSSASYITEKLASTSKEIPQIASGSIDPVEIPQNLDNVDDGVTMEELFPDGNSNFNGADGFQATVAASNNTDRNDIIFDGLENIGGWSDAFNGDGNAYITDHHVIHSSEQTFPINRPIVSSDPMSFLELTDLDIPLSPIYQDPMSFLERNDLNAPYNRYNTNERCFPFSSFGAAYDPGFPDAHMSAPSQFAGLQENVPPNSNEGCNGFEASWPEYDWNPL